MPSGVGLTVNAWNSTTRILSAYNTTTVLTATDGNYYMSVGDKIKFTGNGVASQFLRRVMDI